MTGVPSLQEAEGPGTRGQYTMGVWALPWPVSRALRQALPPKPLALLSLMPGKCTKAPEAENKGSSYTLKTAFFVMS